MLKKIVLTGGPCAGKTTALAKIEQNLKELGYKVFIVSETATELIQSGLSPIDKNGVGIVEFQKYILKMQLQKEEIYNEISSKFPHEKKVIIYDRGMLDGMAFINKQDFDKILDIVSSDMNIDLSYKNIIDRYDMVIHLTTAARGNSNHYTLENNTARSESKEEAIEVDKKIVESWAIHNNLQIIDSYEDFDKKINRILDVIHNFLGNSFTLKKERKFLINNTNLNDLLKNINAIEISIEQYYIEGIKQHYIDQNDEVMEKRLRKVDYEGEVSYYYSIQQTTNEIKKVILERKIDEQVFNKILYNTKTISKISKKRYTFIYNNQYFKLDVFDNFMILEVVSKDSDLIDIPSNFEIIKEVTNDVDYKNINLGKNEYKKIKKFTLLPELKQSTDELYFDEGSNQILMKKKKIPYRDYNND